MSGTKHPEYLRHCDSCKTAKKSQALGGVKEIRKAPYGIVIIEYKCALGNANCEIPDLYAGIIINIKAIFHS